MSDAATEWNERYAEREQRWSGEPNGALVAEVADLSAGSALDVGCGEGADAIWLARQGWQVTGIDISSVAIERAEQAAESAGVEATWIAGDLVDGLPEGSTYDLVAMSYPALPSSSADRSVAALLSAVAPGGMLLVVGHDMFGSEHARKHAEERGFDPADYIQPRDIAPRLVDGWEIEVDEVRPRQTPSGFDGPDIDDVVLRARRL
ncbi:MAG: class I SAM-dependent methyltransferase [Microthrixaceae bacterium]